MRPTPYVASLRIYEPLSAFSPADQLRWKAIPANAATRRDEENRALRRIIRPEPPALRSDGAHILDVGDERFVAPWSTAMRCWAALDSFKESFPTSITTFFVPPPLEDALSINSEDLEDRIPHILTETWVIPPRWFALFEPGERLRGHTPEGPFTVMRTDIATAKRRCETAHRAVVSAFGNGPIEGEIATLLAWLNLFHADSKVECDYGGLALYLEQSLIANGEAGLESDSSIEDVTLSLQGLAAGDGAMAGRGYERLVSRWRRVGAFEQAM
jgi:hypothetical protein